MKIPAGLPQNGSVARPTANEPAGAGQAVTPIEATSRLTDRETPYTDRKHPEAQDVEAATRRAQQVSGLPQSPFAAQLIDQTARSEDDGVYLLRDRAYRASPLASVPTRFFINYKS